MKKSILFLIATLLTAFSFTAYADELTVNNGTETNKYVPFYSFYADTEGTHSQFILPAATLSELLGGEITSLKFFSSYNKTHGGTWQIYLKEVTQTTLSSFVSMASETPVYTGPLNISNRELQINLQSPYVYGGGNLLVDVTLSITGTCGSSSDLFYGVSAPSGSSYYVYGSNNPTAASFLPKMTLSYELPSACPKAKSLKATNVTDSSADIVWTAGGEETQWEVVVGDNAPQVVSAPSYAMSGLTAQTDYSVSVRAICGVGDTSRVSTLAFRTARQTTALPFATGFEDDADNNLWVKAHASNSNKWFTGSATSNGGSKSLYVSNDNGASNEYTMGSSQTSFIFRPFQFAAGDYTITFDWKCVGEYGTSPYDVMRVFVVPGDQDPVGASSSTGKIGVTSVSTSSPTIVPAGWTMLKNGANVCFGNSSAWDEYIGSIHIENGGAYNLVFMWVNDGTGGANPPAAVDNLSIAAKLCNDVKGFNVPDSTIAPFEAKLHWLADESANYDYYVLPASEPSDPSLAVNTTDTFALVQGLAENTLYKAYVRTNCGEGAEGSWNVITFRTACAPLTEAKLPYCENFEGGYPTSGYPLPYCWDAIRYTGSTPYPYVYKSTTSSPAGAFCLNFYGGDASHAPQMAIMPEVEEDFVMSNKRVKFLFKQGSTTATYGNLVVGYVTDAADTTIFVAIDTLPKTAVTTEFEIELTEVPVGARVAFALTNNSSSNTNFYIDNVQLSVIPTCRPSKDMKFVGAEGDGATFAWTPATEQTTGWLVKYKPSEEAAYAEEIVNDSSLTIRGLNKATIYKYDFVLYGYCDGVASPDSVVYNNVQFCTECEIVTVDDTLRYDFEAFEATSMKNIPCWNTYSKGNSTTGGWSVSTTYHVSGTKSAYVSISSNTQYYLETPELDIQNEGMQVMFFARTGYNTYKDSISVCYVASENPNDTVLLMNTGILPYAFPADAYHVAVPAGVKKLIFVAAGNGSVYMDDIVICPAPDCQPATNFVLGEVTAHTVEFSWTAGDENQTYYISVVNNKDPEDEKHYYNAEFNTADLEEHVTSIVWGDEENLGIPALKAQTTDTFTVTIIATCENGVEAEALVFENLIITTGCEPISTEGLAALDTVLYTSFEENEDEAWATGTISSAAHPCWKNERYAGTGSSLFTVSTSYKHTGSNALCLPDQSSGTRVRLTLPSMDLGEEPNVFAISLWVYRNTSSYATEGIRVICGEDSLAFISRNYTVADAAHGIPAETTSGWYQYHIALPATGATDIILQGENAYGSSTYVDDICIYKQETCRAVKSAKIDDITTNAMTLKWDTAYQENEWELLIKQGRDTVIFDTVQVTSLTIDALKPATKYTYSVRIKAVCDGVAATKYFEQSMTFMTACEPVVVNEEHPWSENFDSFSVGDYSSENATCWDFLGNVHTSSTTYPQVYVNNSSGYYRSPSKSLYFKSKANTAEYAILPVMDADFEGMELTFWYRNESVTTSNGLISFGYMTDITDGSSFVSLFNQTELTNIFTLGMADLSTVPAGARLAFRYTGGSTDNYFFAIDDIQIRKTPACRIAESMTLVDSLMTTTSASFLVKGPADDGYKVIFLGKDTVEMVISGEQDSIVVLDKLKPGTYYTYSAQVISNCQAGPAIDTLFVTAKTFMTVCVDADPMNYEADFTVSGNVMPACWDRLGSSTMYPYVSTYSEALYYSGGTSTSRQMAVLPHVAGELGGSRIVFDYATSKSTTSTIYGQLILGYLTDRTDMATFVGLDTLDQTAGSSSYEHYELYLTAVPDTIRDLAILYAGGTSSGSAYIKNLSMSEIPTCFPGTNLHVVDSTITLTSAAFGWTPYDAENLNAHVIVKSGNDTIVDTQVGDTVYVLNNLEHSHYYLLDVMIYTICGELESTDALTAKLAITTECQVVSEFPWKENFDGYPASMSANDFPCWSAEWIADAGYSTSSSSKPWATTASSNATSAPNAIYATYTGNKSLAQVVLPQMDIPAADEYEFRFNIYRPTGSNYLTDEVRVFMNSTPDTVGATRLMAVHRVCSEEPQEAEGGKYQYSAALPNAGLQYVVLQYFSLNGLGAYLDDFEVRKMPDCHKPADFNTEIGTDSIAITWTGNSEKYAIKVWGDTTIVDTVATEKLVIYDLVPATVYADSITITGICGEELSEVLVKKLAFTTECVALTMEDIPFVDGFESYSAFPVCWSRKDGDLYPTISTSSSNAHSGTKSMDFYGSSSGARYLALPKFADDVDLNALRLKFWYKNYSTSSSYSQFEVGTMSDPQDASTFVLATVLDRKSSYTQADVLFNDVPADHHYLVIRLTTASYSYYDHYIDDIEVVLAPTCKKVSAAKVDQVATDSAVLSWTGNSENYLVSFKLNNVADTVLVENADSIVLNDLTPATAYTISDLKIQGICSETDSAEVATFATINFVTECTSLALPYSTDFESGALCFDLPAGVTWTTSYTYYHSSNHVLQFATTDSVTALLPEFEGDLNGKVFSAWWRSEGSGTNQTMGYFTFGYVLNGEFVALSETFDHSYAYVQYVDTLENIPAGARLAINYKDATSSTWYGFIDDVEVYKPVTCFAPEAVAASDITTNSVVLTWDEKADNYRVLVKDGENVLYNDVVEGESLTITDLEPATAYSLSVTITSLCSEEDESEPAVLTVAFTTNCDVIDLTEQYASWAQGFEGVEAGSLPLCMANEAGNWEVTTDGGFAHNGNGAAIADFNGDDDILYLPTFNVGETNVNLSIEAYIRAAVDQSVTLTDTLRLYAKPAEGEAMLLAEFSAVEIGDNYYHVELTNTMLSGEVQLYFSYKAGEEGFRFLVDDILIKQNGGIVTGIFDMTSFGGEKATKILRDNRVYILKAGRLYDVTGRMVR